MSIIDKPAPNPIRIQTIRRNSCAPGAIGELNTCRNMIYVILFFLIFVQDNTQKQLDKADIKKSRTPWPFCLFFDN